MDDYLNDLWREVERISMVLLERGEEAGGVTNIGRVFVVVTTGGVVREETMDDGLDNHGGGVRITREVRYIDTPVSHTRAIYAESPASPVLLSRVKQPKA